MALQAGQRHGGCGSARVLQDAEKLSCTYQIHGRKHGSRELRIQEFVVEARHIRGVLQEEEQDEPMVRIRRVESPQACDRRRGQHMSKMV